MKTYIVQGVKSVSFEVLIQAKDEEQARHKFHQGDYDFEDETNLEAFDIEYTGIEENV